MIKLLCTAFYPDVRRSKPTQETVVTRSIGTYILLQVQYSVSDARQGILRLVPLSCLSGLATGLKRQITLH